MTWIVHNMSYLYLGVFSYSPYLWLISNILISIFISKFTEYLLAINILSNQYTVSFYFLTVHLF